MRLPEILPMPTVLCIEDETHILEELIDELSTSGFNAVGAANATEALRVLDTTTPDIIICDILMPGTNGLQFLEQIRGSRADLAGTPFLFLTALADRSHELTGREAGADDYLTKPIDFDVLILTIRARLAGESHIRTSGSNRTGRRVYPSFTPRNRSAERDRGWTQEWRNRPQTWTIGTHSQRLCEGHLSKTERFFSRRGNP